MDEENKNVNPDENVDEEYEFDELDNKIILNDEEGNEIEFEFLDVVEVEGKEYVVLLPVEEADKGEVVIFRIEGEGEDESYVSLDNEEEAEKVFQVFKEKTKDEFDFAD